jgi:hypothetical protein
MCSFFEEHKESTNNVDVYLSARIYSPISETTWQTSIKFGIVGLRQMVSCKSASYWFIYVLYEDQIEYSRVSPKRLTVQKIAT